MAITIDALNQLQENKVLQTAQIMNNIPRSSKNSTWKPPRGGGGGTCQNFDRDARPVFLGLKFGQILFF